MPDEIDLGDGVTAEFTATIGGGMFRLNDQLVEEPIDLSAEQARKFCAFVQEKASQEEQP